MKSINDDKIYWKQYNYYTYHALYFIFIKQNAYYIIVLVKSLTIQNLII